MFSFEINPIFLYSLELPEVILFKREKAFKIVYFDIEY
jgi:hypothetical protein